MSILNKIIGFSVLSACGTSIVDDRLEPYVQMFIEESITQRVLVNINNLTVVFMSHERMIERSKNPNVIGLCSGRGHNNPVVYINEKYWDSASEEDRMVLMYHELGHCVLGREHNNAAKSGVRLSLMNEYAIPRYFLNDYRYNEELFHPERMHFIWQDLVLNFLGVFKELNEEVMCYE